MALGAKLATAHGSGRRRPPSRARRGLDLLRRRARQLRGSGVAWLGSERAAHPAEGQRQDKAGSLGHAQGAPTRSFFRPASPVVGGLSNDEIAAHLFLSPVTAKAHVSRILTNLEARDRPQLAVVAYESGLATPGGSVSAT